MTNEEYNVLAIDEEHQPIIVEEECKALNPIVKDFVQAYTQNPNAPVGNWLSAKLQEHLPEKSDKEMIDSIISGKFTLKDMENQVNMMNKMSPCFYHFKLFFNILILAE